MRLQILYPDDELSYAHVFSKSFSARISKLEFYFLGLPQPQKAPESRQNPEKYESEKVRSPFWKGWDRIFPIFTRTIRAVTKKVPELRIINRICNRVNGSQLSSFPDLDKKAQKPQKGAETRKAFLELADVR